MEKLIYLPNELLQMITSNLPRPSLTQLCRTCTRSYQLFMPTLYRHIELGHRGHIKQLQQGLARNLYLKEIIYQHTQKLTFKSRQGGSHKFILSSYFSQLPHIQQVYFCDFASLSLDKVTQVTSILPNVELLEFQYCHLHAATTDTMASLTSIKGLTLMWTDFSKEAIRQLFEMAQSLNRVQLGANHNRYCANDAAITALTLSCPQINQVSISLQQVKEGSICQMIKVLGAQLEQLSIRFEGNETIQTIAEYTKRLQHLVIRYHEGNSDDFVNMLQRCKSLTRLEMVSWPLHDVPTVVLDHCKAMMVPTGSFIEDIKRTVALDGQDLQQIRNLYSK